MSKAPDALRFINGYPAAVQQQVQTLIAEGRLGAHLANRYPGRHAVQTDKALNDYTQALKQAGMRSAPPIHKVIYDGKLDVLRNALGLHSSISRVQGSRLTAKSEIRIAALFKTVAPEFLEMIVVHELAHLRHAAHDKGFYQLCQHLLPEYHQIEFDLRLLLILRELLPSNCRI